MRSILTAALIAGIAVPTPAGAEALRLKPSTKWFLDYAEDSCRLARKFGEGEQQVTLFLDQFEPGDEFQMILGGNILQPLRDARPHKMMLQFGPPETGAEVHFDTGKMDGTRAVLVNGRLRIVPYMDAEKEAGRAARDRGEDFEAPPVGRAREQAVQWLQLLNGLKWDLVLETGSMAEPMDALRKCSWDTVKLWGLDVEQQKALLRKPLPKNPQKPWFQASDYPRKMAREGYEAIVNFRLIIDATGKPKTCHVQTSTRPKEFDDAVCSGVMKRARFNPALDAQGTPVESFYRQTIVWRLEG
jgi:TonB family protein